MSEIGHIKQRSITDEMQEAYLDYAMSVIVARALPDVRDGLKPVHRRILYAMHELGLTAGAKFVKSARIVGEVLGKYHPHGDMAVYDTLVRLAQNFNLRYPLVRGQGNFGCFTKETKVRLADGRNLSFGDLINEDQLGKRNFTFTIAESGQIEIAEIKNPRLTRKNVKIVEVTIDNGETICCTPDHRFMLRDGSYRQASELRTDDSLMPIYSQIYGGSDKNLIGYEQIYQPHADIWTFTHHLADNFNLANKVYSRSRGRIRHHINFNKLNNDPTNIQHGCATTWGKGVEKYFKDNPALIPQTLQKNHRVKKVRPLKEQTDVYDLTVEDTHNFCLAAGVFVHNSLDGDSAAAQRYTEAKMTAIAEELLADIEKETVNFADNYDASRKEPTVLPARIPQLLLNGTVGIAVGMATNIPPHNLTEVVDATMHLIKHPRAATEDLLQFVKGPDFPTGGIIYSKKDIAEAYATGRGPMVTRGRAEATETKSGHAQILITEIPYQVNKASLIEKIAELVHEKRIEGIRDLRDESDKDNAVRIVIELKNDAHPNKILNNLYKFTDLQRTFHMNMLALVDGIQPQVLSLKAVLENYLKHREDVVVKRTKYDLKRAEERAHILEGLKKALDHIDEIIRTIKKSEDKEDAHKNLVSKFKLTSIQASAILEMKLQTLAGLERKKIEDELVEKRKLIKELIIILKNRDRVLEIIREELEEIKKKYGDERRTKIVATALGEIKEEDLVPQEETLIALTQSGYIKRMNPGLLRAQHRGGKGVSGIATREEDAVTHFVASKTHDNALFFTNTGRVFQTKVWETPEASRQSRGKALVNFLALGPEEQVNAILTYDEKASKAKGSDKYLVMATQNGMMKKTAIEEFHSVRRSGLIAIKLRKDDNLRWVRASSGEDQIILVSSGGQAIRFSEKDCRPLGRATAGVSGIKLRKGDKVVGMDVVDSAEIKDPNSKLLVIMANGYGKRTLLKFYKKQKRAGVGIKTAKITPKTGLIVAAQVVPPESKEIIAISERGTVIRTEVESISTLGRATQGVRIMKVEPGDKVASVTLF